MEQVRIKCAGKDLDFEIRKLMPGGEMGSDAIVLREQFTENVYNLASEKLQGSGVVVDIGANIGAFSVHAAALGAKHVLALEPESDNFELLCKNIGLNHMAGIIMPLRLGVLGHGDRAILYRQQGASWVASVRATNPNEPALFEEIQVVSFANIFKLIKGSEVDFLKVDCEGSEYSIFEAADEALLNCFARIEIEYHATTTENFGRLLAKLSLTHNTTVYGDYLRTGGQIHAIRY